MREINTIISRPRAAKKSGQKDAGQSDAVILRVKTARIGPIILCPS
jgi:hypothetical protein